MLTDMFLKLAFVGSEWVMWILLILSFVNVSIVVERILYLRRTKIDEGMLHETLTNMLRGGDLQGAYNTVAGQEAVECGVVAAGLTAVHRGAHACSEAMLGAKAQLKGNLDARLSILGTIGSNAPFIGLMGTVLGIIKAANDLTGGSSGQANPNAVMAGVFEALVATAVGLLVAIPAVVCFNIFNRIVKTRMASIDALAHLVLTFVHVEKRPGGAAAVEGHRQAAQPAVARS